MKNLIYGALGIVFSLFILVTTMGDGMDLYEMIDFHLAPWFTDVVRWVINSVGIFLGALAVYTIIRAIDNWIREF